MTDDTRPSPSARSRSHPRSPSGSRTPDAHPSPAAASENLHEQALLAASHEDLVRVIRVMHAREHHALALAASARAAKAAAASQIMYVPIPVAVAVPVSTHNCISPPSHHARAVSVGLSASPKATSSHSSSTRAVSVEPKMFPVPAQACVSPKARARSSSSSSSGYEAWKPASLRGKTKAQLDEFERSQYKKYRKKRLSPAEYAVRKAKYWRHKHKVTTEAIDLARPSFNPRRRRPGNSLVMPNSGLLLTRG